MTITPNRIHPQPLPATRSDVQEMLGILRDTGVAISELNPDLLHSATSVGHAVVTLAGAARAAAAALGADPGTNLDTAAGVVVARDLVAAVSLLELAASRPGGPTDPRAMRLIRRRATIAYDRFLLALPVAT